MDDILNDPMHPDRPQSPDFWNLSSIILEMDGAFLEGKSELSDYIAEEIDFESVVYMAIQRSLRARDLTRSFSIESTAALYMEAIVVGMRYERRYSKHRA